MDQQIIIKCVLVLIGLFIGWIIARLSYGYFQANYLMKIGLLEITYQQQQQNLKNLQNQLQKREQEFYHLQSTLNNSVQVNLQQLDYWREENKAVNQELRNQLEINNTQKAEICAVNIRLEEILSLSEKQQRLFINSEQRLSTQFENLANHIFEKSSRRIDEQYSQSLNSLIRPLHEQLESFRRLINDNFNKEIGERYVLVNEVNQLKQLNIQMAQEVINFTNALKGNNKIQGNWGEVVLQRVLESSGLREGYEYDIQVSFQIEEHGKMQPDVIVHLPQSKDVIIDSKMTLIAYERYFNAEDDVLREQAIQEHINSVRNHIKLLGKKDYQHLPGLHSLDYVLMFIPIEPAFLLAINRQPELISEALQQNIMLVSPTTLLVALRTINNLWRYENQNCNAQLIAERAARLYDKIRLFIDDMNQIGINLDKTQQNYQLAMKKLSEGRGNLIAQSEAFRSLGVEIKRSINPKILSNAQLEKHDD